MADSLRDQLLKAGFVSKAKPASERRESGNKKRGGKRRPPQAASGGSAAPASGEVDLARAYAMRAKAEASERRREKEEAERQARERKERKRKLQDALQGAVLNKPDAELMRHFEYGGKIRRVHVDADQLARINAGELVVVQQGGRYLLVTLEVAEKILAFAPEHIALQVDPDAAPAEGDDGVPDDLVW
ncbi:DUF2058 domain-containing protein [Oleiagrimonas soli]|uniref:Nucleoprotein/polynucleotide-associated enzyme n=1 Tax=Oleiagrimonas soli TaxID=1543381 RepID=A0A099CWU8_9GAMM|nr:DUF2058 family protein [Oleiagrimonas soli]KGI77470.1 nucleoprotein/polynucleotide-associated enzyme [Oleiagrimonas soli]MBB6183083.1 uncharacterized protein YaiL (DUF2058 family) [Oleiagrimonas soli]